MSPRKNTIFKILKNFSYHWCYFSFVELIQLSEFKKKVNIGKILISPYIAYSFYEWNFIAKENVCGGNVKYWKVKVKFFCNMKLRK